MLFLEGLHGPKPWEPKDSLALFEALARCPAGLVVGDDEFALFVELEPVDDASLDAAVAGSSFDELKAIERSGSSSSKRLRPEDAENGDSYKVRRGKVGGYVDYFSLEEIEEVDQILSTHISALYPYK